MTSEKIIFYAMKGCGHCENAEIALAEEINSGKIKILSNFEAPYGVQGFPHFVNTINKKTLTGWPGSKKDLLERLECKEFYDDIDDFFNTPIKDMYGKPPIKENFSENYEHESMPSHPVVQSIEPIPPSIHYYHDMGAGYSKLSNCWVKRPDFTA